MRCKLLKIICFSIVMTTGFCGLILNTTPTHAANKCESCKCLRFEVTKKQNSSGKTNSEDSKDKTKWYCAKVNESGIITSEKLIDLVDSEDGDYYANGKIRYQQDTKDSKPAATFTFRNSNQGSSRASYTSTRQTKDNKWSTFFGNVKSDLNGKSISDTPYRYTISNIYETSTDDKGNATSIAEDDDPEDQEGQYADEAGGGGDEVTCYSGAKSLGWIICPILDTAADVAEQAYEKFIQPALVVEPELLNDDSDNGTRQAWGIFQGFANIVFIILLLLVIFSQVTGVGINNYGIKKILPKLIVAAILINISYFICQLAVDVSNILGNGLKSLMDGLTEGLQINNTTSVEGSTITIATGNVLSFLAILAAVVAATGAIWTMGLAIIFPLLLGALSVAIAIIFLFFLLAVRQAGVIVLVVISPIAFVCYMLPNTKTFFDKWKKIFIALLALFPIVGLVMGAGNFVSTLLLSTSGGNASFFLAMTAMIVGVAPIFAIPILLKSSMAAMGNIGAKISGVGSKLGKGATGKVRNSQNYQQRMQRARAGLNSRGEESARGRLARRAASTRVGRFVGAERALASSRSVADSNRAKDTEATRALLKTPTQNYDVDTMASMLLGKNGHQKAKGAQRDALVTALAQSGGYGAKQLHKLAEEGSAEDRQHLSRMMADNQDVSKAMNRNGYMAQYMRDINKEGNYSQEYSSWAAGGGEDRVFNDVLDTYQDKFSGQSSSSQKTTIRKMTDAQLTEFRSSDSYKKLEGELSQEARDMIKSRLGPAP